MREDQERLPVIDMGNIRVISCICVQEVSGIRNQRNSRLSMQIKQSISYVWY